jgi:hypothetical protein
MADVEIGAAAEAKRIKFKHVPDTDVQFDADATDAAESRTVRENLPEQVEESAEYEDVRIGWLASVEIDGRTRKGKRD